MEGEFGTFMALTGLHIHGADAAQIDLARGIVQDTYKHAEEVSDAISSMPPSLVGGKTQFE
jgi:enoyl-CoA hydratase/carnithine racemase